MSGTGYKIRDQHAIHFITFCVVNWADVFSRRMYADIFLDSVKHCQLEKGLKVHAWCIMTNHVHMAVSTQENRLSDIVRDMKKYSSKAIVAAIENNAGESRRSWLLNLFREAGEKNSRNNTYQFWGQDNHPMEMYSLPFIRQKVEYIHLNPVRAGFVSSPEHYLLSSAGDYGGIKGPIEVEPLY